MMKAHLKLIIAMLIFGSIGLFVRQIPLPSSVIALCRGFSGSIFLLIAAVITKMSWNFPSIKRNLPLLIFSGAALGFNWILFFEAFRYTTVSAATLAYYCAPVFIVLLSPILLKESLTLNKIAGIAMAMLGMVLVNGMIQGGADPLKGMLFGLAAACFYASVVLMNKFIRDLSSLETTIIQMIAAAFVLLPYVILTEDIASLSLPQGTGLLCLFIVGIVHTGIAYTLYFGSIKELPTQTAAVFSYIDPVSALFFASIFLQEWMNSWQWLGALLILGGAVCMERKK